MRLQIPRAWFFLLFTISGFAGLIYESIWSHYLKLFLGHAAYAQTLVLAMFMGGMALGAWVCSRYSARWKNLLTGYAVAEAAIGGFALVFHDVFVAATDFAYEVAMPALGSPFTVTAFKWVLSGALLLPQSVLLGMTFPLMSAGVIRAYPDRSGSSIAMLYFTNSLGAAVGVLASGFLLIGLVGLPGTLLTAGLLNLLLAAVVWLSARDLHFEPPSTPKPDERGAMPLLYGMMMTVALLTGAASFIYEIGWIRMLSMVLGSSTHAFELMLSAFILGLAFGGLWIKRRIDRIGNPERALGAIQVAMGVLALLTLLVYGKTFELMQWLLGAVNRTDGGYALFHTGSHGIAMLVMFLPAFCAGTTLPLITHSLLRRGAGERAIGSVYAANTVGAIVGVFAAVHFGLPFMGLKGTITFGAAIDIGLGVLLLSAHAPIRERWASAAIGGVAILASLFWVELDALKMASGVYRHGALFRPENARILYQRDGKSATVNLVEIGDKISIHTNGKSDAALRTSPGSEMTVDEATMVMAAALPLMFHPDAKSVANIGFGSGLTAHVLLASRRLQQVDTIEIESAMVEAAHGFSPRNDRVYRDARSRIHIEDAKTYFSTYNKKYDVIISEPSNPWVSGVASLFGEEFYRRIGNHLADDGLLVQWMQLYEITPQLVASVFKALARHFSDYAVYASYDLDIIIVAKKKGRLPELSAEPFSEPALKRELERIRIFNLADVDLHRVGGRRALQPYFEAFPIAPNSDYFPVLDLYAAKARFMHQSARDIVRLAIMPIPAVELLDGRRKRGGASDAERPWLTKGEQTRRALAARRYLLDGESRMLAGLPDPLDGDLRLTRLLGIECAGDSAPPATSLHRIAIDALAVLAPHESRDLWQKVGESSCFGRNDPTQRAWVALYAAVGERDAAEMARRGEALLRARGPVDPARRRYAAAAAITGRLVLGDVEAARALWTAYRTDFPPGDMLAEFLHGHLLP